MLEFRTGTGLRFTVLVDRAMDLAEVEHNGRAVGWHSPAGFRNPALHEYEGEGGLAWARSFSGLLVTCGLDHILGPEEVPAESYNYPGRKTVRHSLHGRVADDPGATDGLWRGVGRATAACSGPRASWCRRRYSARCCISTGGSRSTLAATRSRITDRVVNRGLLADAAHVVLPRQRRASRDRTRARAISRRSPTSSGPAMRATEYRAQGVGYDRMPAAAAAFSRTGLAACRRCRSRKVGFPLHWSTTGCNSASRSRSAQGPVALPATSGRTCRPGNYVARHRTFDPSCAGKQCRARRATR